ncbi:hypothetical protein [Lactobacillus crispatus]|uniref:hypothetical protein n=1 Tax=Lactobacillus crispatus TaxID=47770 RepID=UPI001F09E698|nr:hypothetical protein [Lactobacillus crispatus]
MVTTKKTTTKKKTTKKVVKQEMKAQSVISYKFPDSSYTLTALTPFSADSLIEKFETGLKEDGVFSTLTGLDSDFNIVPVEHIKDIKYWVSFGIPAKYIRFISGVPNE